MSVKYYGIEQCYHGHCYRYIFEEKVLLENAKKYHFSFHPNGDNVDISFPIGGSNSSSTMIVPCGNMEEIRSFLTEKFYTDYDDPELVDIAEGLCTIDTSNDYGSCTKEMVERLGISSECLTTECAYKEKVDKIIQTLKDADYDCEIDFENPYYGTSKDMNFSEIKNIYNDYEFLQQREL